MSVAERKLPTGYEGDNIPSGFSIPPLGIEDVDRAVFNLFEKILSFEVLVDSQTTHVPVVFASGERFALTRRKQPIRDKHNTLILPLISIHRTSVSNDPSQGGLGSAIAFRPADVYFVRRRLSEQDRAYQRIVNKLRLKNQDDTAALGHLSDHTNSPGGTSKPGTLASRRQNSGNGNLSMMQPQTDRMLADDLGNNIFEIISIPYPRFLLLEYDVTFWTQYTTQMNLMIETLFARLPGQGREYLLHTEAGYELVAFVSAEFRSGDNFENFSDDERVIKYSFTLRVPAYTIALDQPGLDNPFRRYHSAPQIEFGVTQTNTQAVDVGAGAAADTVSSDLGRFTLSDVSNIDRAGQPVVRRGEAPVRLVQTVQDPFSQQNEVRLLRVITRDQRSGESVISEQITVDLETDT